VLANNGTKEEYPQITIDRSSRQGQEQQAGAGLQLTSATLIFLLLRSAPAPVFSCSCLLPLALTSVDLLNPLGDLDCYRSHSISFALACFDYYGIISLDISSLSMLPGFGDFCLGVDGKGV